MTPARFVGLALICLLLGGVGFVSMSCVSHLYNDHQLIDAYRANEIRQLQQLQQQQAQPK